MPASTWDLARFKNRSKKGKTVSHPDGVTKLKLGRTPKKLGRSGYIEALGGKGCEGTLRAKDDEGFTYSEPLVYSFEEAAAAIRADVSGQLTEADFAALFPDGLPVEEEEEESK